MERRKKYGIFLLILLTSGLCLYGYFSRSSPGSGTLSKTDFHMGASDLAATFEREESVADSLYLFKAVSVSGIVRNVRKTSAGNFSISLGDRNLSAAAVNCIFDIAYSRHPAPFLAGDSLTVWGTCAGYLTDVVIVQCVIETK